MIMHLRHYLQNRSGASAAEYGVIASLAALGSLAAVGDLSTTLEDLSWMAAEFIGAIDASIVEAVGG